MSKRCYKRTLHAAAAARRTVIRYYFDYKSPFAFLAKEPTYALEADFADVEIQWLPFSFNMDVSFGLPHQRSEWQWNKVLNGYKDARMFANRRDPPLTLLGPQRAADSSLPKKTGGSRGTPQPNGEMSFDSG